MRQRRLLSHRCLHPLYCLDGPCIINYTYKAMQSNFKLCSKNKPEEFESLLDQLKFIFAKIRYPRGPHCPICHPEMKIIAQKQ